MNYATLQANVIDYTHRDDLAPVVPTMIALAESYMFRELNLRDLETSISGTTSGGVIALPADFGAVSRLTINYGGTQRALDYASDPSNYTAGGGTPSTYALEGNAIKLFPTPGDGYAYTLYYTIAIDPLTDANPTNWLLANASDLYLYACALEVAKYTRDMTQVDALSKLVAGLLESARRLAERKGQPARGGMQMKLRNRPL